MRTDFADTAVTTSPATSSAPSALPEGLELLRIEPQIYCYGLYRNVTLAVWVGQATLPALHAMGGISRDMVRRFPQGHSSIVFILDKIPAPSQEASDLIARAFNTRNGLACVSVIIEGTGFWGSGMRSMLSNARRSAAGESSALLRLNSSSDEAVAWLPDETLRRTGVRVEPSGLADALRWVRERGAAQALAAAKTP
jgi:hypothetical protein